MENSAHTYQINGFTLVVNGGDNPEETKELATNLIELIGSLRDEPSDFLFQLNLFIEEFINPLPFYQKNTFIEKLSMPLNQIIKGDKSQIIYLEDNFLPLYKTIYSFVRDDISKKYNNNHKYEKNYETSREIKLQELLQFSRAEIFNEKPHSQADQLPTQANPEAVITTTQATQTQTELNKKSNTLLNISSSFDITIQQERPQTKSACCLLI